MNHYGVFEEELAEMLSADMQKEGLWGQTLTLKLKTASFEVLLVIDDLTLFSLNIFLILVENSLVGLSPLNIKVDWRKKKWFVELSDLLLLKSNVVDHKDIMICWFFLIFVQVSLVMFLCLPTIYCPTIIFLQVLINAQPIGSK